MKPALNGLAIEQGADLLFKQCPNCVRTYKSFSFRSTKPRPNFEISNKSDIIDKLNDINAKFLSVQDHQFKDIRTLALVGGSKSKTLAIWSLLRNDSYNIELLCTDEEAARILVELTRQSPL